MKENKERFIDSVRSGRTKKKSIPEELAKIMNEKKFFTNEDIELDSSCYDNWNSYEIKLIRRFLDDNTYKYTVGELLDEGLITESTNTRRKMVYSHFTKQELLNQKMAED